MTGFCRDCLTAYQPPPAGRGCPHCASPRLLAHGELDDLTIAHIDCDAFFAAVEKRDHPDLVHKPLIIGGGRRGVVATACYIARTYGIRSAMPMYRARKACPEAVVLAPDQKKYRAVSRQVFALMRETTPLVEPLSVDEAFLDLSGTRRLHKGSPARTLAVLIQTIERELGITASVGLSYNKFLAKVASDLDKPRGFSVIGRAEARQFLACRPVTTIYGVGKALARRLAGDGLTTLGQIQAMSAEVMTARYGAIGHRLAGLARGDDERPVVPTRPVKSLSAETTFERDIADPARLEAILWGLCERLAGRLKEAGLCGAAISLKLKTAGFRIVTRSRRLDAPSQLADVVFRAARLPLKAEAQGQAYRLIGIGVSDLEPAGQDLLPGLLDHGARRRAAAERALDRVRQRFGSGAIGKGRGLGRDKG